MKKILVFIFSIVLFGSCDIEVEGCTDINASNYNSEVIIDVITKSFEASIRN